MNKCQRWPHKMSLTESHATTAVCLLHIILIFTVFVLLLLSEGHHHHASITRTEVCHIHDRNMGTAWISTSRCCSDEKSMREVIRFIQEKDSVLCCNHLVCPLSTAAFCCISKDALQLNEVAS